MEGFVVEEVCFIWKMDGRFCNLLVIFLFGFFVYRYIFLYVVSIVMYERCGDSKIFYFSCEGEGL